MNRHEAIVEAQRLEKEAADLSAEAYRKLGEADRLRCQYQTWLQASLAAASAEVNCWPEGYRRVQKNLSSCLS